MYQFSLTHYRGSFNETCVTERSRFLENFRLLEKNFAPIYLSRGRGRVNGKKVSRTRQHSAFLPFPEERLKKEGRKEERGGREKIRFK